MEVNTQRNICMLSFVASNAFLKRLHGMGLSASSKQAKPITPDEESLLWTSGQLGTHSAKALLNTVYFYNCKAFGYCFVVQILFYLKKVHYLFNAHLSEH